MASASTLATACPVASARYFTLIPVSCSKREKSRFASFSWKVTYTTSSRELCAAVSALQSPKSMTATTDAAMPRLRPGFLMTCTSCGFGCLSLLHVPYHTLRRFRPHQPQSSASFPDAGFPAGSRGLDALKDGVGLHCFGAVRYHSGAGWCKPASCWVLQGGARHVRYGRRPCRP